jgi:hypothetical protein
VGVVLESVAVPPLIDNSKSLAVTAWVAPEFPQTNSLKFTVTFAL